MYLILNSSRVCAKGLEALSLNFTIFIFLQYNGANIQLLDLPGIIEGAASGKGRGRQVIAVGRTADLIIMMLDAGKGEVQRYRSIEMRGDKIQGERTQWGVRNPEKYYKPEQSIHEYTWHVISYSYDV